MEIRNSAQNDLVVILVTPHHPRKLCTQAAGPFFGATLYAACAVA